MSNGVFCSVMLFFCLTLGVASNAARSDEPDQVRASAAAALQASLDQAAKLTDPKQKVSLLSQSLMTVCQQIPSNVLLAEMFDRLNSANGEARQLAAQWQAACNEANEILRFEVLVESPTPDGFPRPTPVGEVQVLQYPAYRLAKTDMTFIEGRAFWTLFSHIKEHKIAMTAPVEMTYRPDDAAKKQSMSFLYRNIQQGTAGKSGSVDVIDIPAQTVVSIGLRGDATTSRVAEAKRRLDKWLQAHAQECTPNGSLRVFAYNSPFVADAKKFAEVQIPIQVKTR